MIKDQDIFVTGGAGTLGKAIARRRKEEGWTGKLTIYSTDAGKHSAMRSLYPGDRAIRFIQGDILDQERLHLAMIGHDIVIHAAAVKFIPDSEYSSMNTIDVNVTGSNIVCAAAYAAGVKKVIGISTDKACHPANAYGSSKHLMEKIFQEYAMYSKEKKEISFHLVRYGNVLESRGSVIETWKNAVERNETIKITNPEMTRFWLSPSQAVDYVLRALEITPNGRIFVPLMPALNIWDLMRYTVGEVDHIDWEEIPMRPGEKLHEMLITEEEQDYTEHFRTTPAFSTIHPSTDPRLGNKDLTPYTSQNAPQLTRADLHDLLRDG